VADPEVLILDEPTEGLDPNQRNEIRSLIKKIAKKKTIILCTHVMQEVSAMCDRVIIIDKGKMVLDGKPEELGRGQSNKIYLSVKGEDLKNKLSKLSTVMNVKDIQKKNRQEKDFNQYEIGFNGDEKFYQALSELVAEEHGIIYELRRESVSLEDLFYKVTKQKTK
jgi:ABC-2 type transport system ATP-binding protein